MIKKKEEATIHNSFYFTPRVQYKCTVHRTGCTVLFHGRSCFFTSTFRYQITQLMITRGVIGNDIKVQSQTILLRHVRRVSKENVGIIVRCNEIISGFFIITSIIFFIKTS